MSAATPVKFRFDLDLGHRASGAEGVSQIGFRRVVGKIAHIESFAHGFSRFDTGGPAASEATRADHESRAKLHTVRNARRRRLEAETDDLQCSYHEPGTAPRLDRRINESA